jgi:predicted AAA+ superfamily ATPase
VGFREKSVVWLSGVRRAGKTMLSKSLAGIEYFDCELPRVRHMMEDPQSFLEDLRGRTIVLDEIHRLNNPSEMLKIAADHYPETKILATGSSTLGATTKFKDTLAGRKYEIWLTPMMSADLADFGRKELPHRFIRGGLPPFFLSKKYPEHDFQEWMESFWAKDIQELFRLERRHSFLKFAELLMIQSGGLFEATRFARPCEVSRSTIANYLAVLETTYVAHVVRPFSTHRPTEIISAPKVYAFDSGFVCHYKGWYELRRDDYGILWEHYVLNEMHAQVQTRKVLYWRDKRGHEVDFVLAKRQGGSVAVECKWSSAEFDIANIKAFRTRYSAGDNYVVAPDIERPFSRTYDDLYVRFVNLADLIKAIAGLS